MKYFSIFCLTVLAVALSGCPKPALSVEITAQGANSAGLLVVTPHSDVTFVAAVKGGTKPYLYQWYRNGTVIEGAILDYYIKANVAESDTGFYECHVTDSDGTKSEAEVSATKEAVK